MRETGQCGGDFFGNASVERAQKIFGIGERFEPEAEPRGAFSVGGIAVFIFETNEQALAARERSHRSFDGNGKFF